MPCWPKRVFAVRRAPEFLHESALDLENIVELFGYAGQGVRKCTVGIGCLDGFSPSKGILGHRPRLLDADPIVALRVELAGRMIRGVRPPRSHTRLTLWFDNLPVDMDVARIRPSHPPEQTPRPIWVKNNDAVSFHLSRHRVLVGQI